MSRTTTLLILSPDGDSGDADALAESLDGALSRRLPRHRGSAGGRMAAAITAAERVLEDVRPAAAVLCGHEAETGAAALVAAKLGIPLARVGAGAGAAGADELGGGLTDRLCELLLCGDDAAVERLARRGLADRARVVGDVHRDAAPAASVIGAWAGSYTARA